MKVELGRVERAQVARLISESGNVTLTDTDRATLNQCLLMTSNFWLGTIEGKVICAWGLIPPTLMSEQAYLWLYCTPALETHKFIFIRRSQIAVREMLEEYPTITGITRVGANQTIQWLGWLGAKFGPAIGNNLPFVIRKNNNG